MLIINYILGKSELISYSDQYLLSRQNVGLIAILDQSWIQGVNGWHQNKDRDREFPDGLQARKDSVRNWNLPARLRGAHDFEILQCCQA